MELTQLRSFLQVAESGTITRAAERLYLTQPAVTQHIQALEGELGVALFDRLPRGMRLTQAGTLLYEYARRCLASLEDCRLALTELEAGRSGHLAIGAGVTTSIFVLPEWLRAFRERCTDVDVIIHTGRSREILALLKDGDIDLGIVTTPGEQSNMTFQRLFDEEICLVVPADHRFAGQKITTERFGEIPLILFPAGNGFRAYVDQALAQSGMPLLVKMESDSVEAIKRFVEVGLGASFLPISAVQEELTRGTLARVSMVNTPPLRRTTYLAWMTNRYQTTSMRTFMALTTSSMANPTFKE
ncbi:MAG: LysR family transcriptional regulator [Armatimonadota bacterium]